MPALILSLSSSVLLYLCVETPEWFAAPLGWLFDTEGAIGVIMLLAFLCLPLALTALGLALSGLFRKRQRGWNLAAILPAVAAAAYWLFGINWD